MKKADIGLIGLAVMGANLARNIAKYEKIIVYNRTTEKTKIFLKEFGNKNLDGTTDLKTFVQKLKRPRKIIIMVQAGEAVDSIIGQLLKHIQAGDVIIDCGNSNFKDTQRRFLELQKQQINFFGCGVSGGEEGALNGPSLMPGGNQAAYKKIEPTLKKIAARDFSGRPCVTFVGENGAGHFVKMVHNGIEYGVMQLMAESYDALRKIYKLTPPQIADIFAKFNKGKLKSYLFEIAVNVLRQTDPYKKGFLVDYINDKASQKGTGALTAISALQKGSALSLITESVFARTISSEKTLRQQLNKIYRTSSLPKPPLPLKEFTLLLEKALYGAMLIAYSEGFNLIQKTAEEEKWDLNLAEISRIWQGGCIIRADILKILRQAYSKKINQKKFLLLIPKIAKEVEIPLKNLRKIIATFTKSEIPKPAFSAALNYFDAIKTASSPANFVQALRDYFGAHTYERTDRKGIFHTNWT